MSLETKYFTVSPTSGLAPNITPAALRSPPTVTQSAPAMQSLVQFGFQLLAILSDIDANPSSFTSPDAAHEQPVCASPLTERSLRYQRREASRTGRSTVASTPLPNPTDSPHPLDDFCAENRYQYRLLSTPARQKESLDLPILSNISSPGPEQCRSTPTHSQPRKPFAHSTPATFPRMTQALHMAEQRSFSAGFRCPPRSLPLHDLSRAPRSMSSPTTTSPASKIVAKELRPSADTNAHTQGTSSPVTSSTLHAISGSDSDRPTDYARTPQCLRGPFWVTLADLPPTCDVFNRFGPVWSPPSEHGLAPFPFKTQRPASPSHERQRTETIRHVRQRTPAHSLWPRENMPSPCNRCRRGRPPSTANTPTSGVASATSRPSGVLTPRR